MGTGEKNDMNALIFVCKTLSFLSKSNYAVKIMQDTSRTFRTYVRLFTSNLSWVLPAHRLRVILQTFSQCYAFISIYLKKSISLTS